MSRFIDANGIAKVLIISPGQGTSAYYKEQQLKRDADAFKDGLSFIDHPGKAERHDRPERSLRDLVGPIVGTPVYSESGRDGPGLYGAVKVAKHWRPFIEELGSTLGISLRAAGSAIYESIGGKRTRVAEKFNPGAGFDFVTRAGRGGKMVPLLEAATAAADGAVDRWLGSASFVESDDGRTDEERFLEYLEDAGEDTMEKNELQTALDEATTKLKAAEDKAKTLETENARLAEALGLRQAQDIITEALGKDTVKLHDATKARIVKTLSESAPIVEGKLDTEKLATMVAEAITAETEYVESIVGRPGITGMGGGASEDDSKGTEKLLARKKAQYMREGKDEAAATALAQAFVEAGR